MRDFDANFNRLSRLVVAIIGLALFAVVSFWITIGYLVATTDVDDVARGLGSAVKTFREAEGVK